MAYRDSVGLAWIFWHLLVCMAGLKIERMMVETRTIFDLGMHRGSDTDFYLAKGFRVVALEANPVLCVSSRSRFAEPIRDGRLVIVNKALASEAGQTATFYMRTDEKDDWSSLDEGVAERDGVISKKVEVETTTLSELIGEHGVPYYLKCDMEGADKFVVEQLTGLTEMPKYLPVEWWLDYMDTLVRCGYDRFQIINQSQHHKLLCPHPPREGRYVQRQFDGHMSGLFGKELNPANWANATVTARRIDRWHNLTNGRQHKYVRSLWKRYGKLTDRTWLIHGGWAGHSRRTTRLNQ